MENPKDCNLCSKKLHYYHVTASISGIYWTKILGSYSGVNIATGTSGAIILLYV